MCTCNQKKDQDQEPVVRLDTEDFELRMKELRRRYGADYILAPRWVKPVSWLIGIVLSVGLFMVIGLAIRSCGVPF